MSELEQLKAELASLAASFKVPAYLEFAKGLAAGKSQEQAYIDAGYKSKRPNEDASKVIARCPTIVQYKNLVLKINQLELTPKQIATFEEKAELLWRIAQHDSKTVASNEDEEGDVVVRDSRSAIAAVAELNKMQGHLASIKVDNNNKTVIRFDIDLG